MGHAIEDDTGAVVPFSGRFVVDADGVQHPLKNMSATAKAAFGVFEVTQAPPPAEAGLMVVGYELVRDGEGVLRKPVTQPAPVEQLLQGIKAEANRRILTIVPEWKQRNLLAQATQLAKKGEANWTSEDRAAWDAGEAIWAQVLAIRSASDGLEQLDPLPTDYDDDRHWP